MAHSMSTVPSRQTVTGYKTAIARAYPSAPMRFLYKQGYLRYPALDYGCGRGRDAAYFGMEGYDPYYAPGPILRERYASVVCQYVLNVMSAKEADEVLARILALGERVLVTVRRDIPRQGTATQRWVELDWPILRQNHSYCIYTAPEALIQAQGERR